MATRSEIIGILTNIEHSHMVIYNRLSDIMPLASVEEIETLIAVFTAGRELQRRIIVERMAEATERLY